MKILWWTGSRWRRVDFVHYNRTDGCVLAPDGRATVVPLEGDDRDPVMVPLDKVRKVEGRKTDPWLI